MGRNGGTARQSVSSTEPWDDVLHRFAHSLEESARVLRNVALLGRTGVAEPILDRIEEEGVKAKIRAETFRNMLKDWSNESEPA
jgi:hypothetical protein